MDAMILIVFIAMIGLILTCIYIFLGLDLLNHFLNPRRYELERKRKVREHFEARKKNGT